MFVVEHLDGYGRVFVPRMVDKLTADEIQICRVAMEGVARGMNAKKFPARLYVAVDRLRRRGNFFSGVEDEYVCGREFFRREDGSVIGDFNGEELRFLCQRAERLFDDAGLLLPGFDDFVHDPLAFGDEYELTLVALPQ